MKPATVRHDRRAGQPFLCRSIDPPGHRAGTLREGRPAKGEMLEVVGILIPADSVSDRCTSYADVYKFRVGADLLIPTGYGGLANHSASPNMEKIITGKQVYLRALRPIEPGEELLYVYNRHARGQFGEGLTKAIGPSQARDHIKKIQEESDRETLTGFLARKKSCDIF